MIALMWVAGSVAALLHLLFFCMESLWWNRPAIRRRFGLTDAQADASRLFAFNQGFYNLFLALGVAVGLTLLFLGYENIGVILAGWSCLSMLGAAIVLSLSAPRLRRAAIVQGAPPLVFLIVAAIRSMG